MGPTKLTEGCAGRLTWLAIMPVLLVLLSGISAFGCSCAGGGSPCQNYGRAAAVFVGTPIAVSKNERPPDRNREEYSPPRTFRFSVEQTFLGQNAPEIEVSTGMGGGDCGYDFKLGTRYVVYASLSGSTGRLMTGICSRTNPLELANEDIEFLRSLNSLAPGVTLDGIVARQKGDVAKGDNSPAGPLADVGLVVAGESGRTEVSTDAKGQFVLRGLPAGKYKITLLLPDALSTYRPEQEIWVADRGCASVSYSVVDNGRLSGRVLDPEGQPAARVNLQLMEAEHTDPMKYWGKSAKSDDQGRYSFSAIPPGRYLLAVNLSRYPDPIDPTNAYPRTYYPGVSDPEKAEIITVGSGEQVPDREFTLPVRRAPSVLTGKVVWEDGTPVAKAGITYREVTYHDSKANYGLEADEQGYFTIKGYVGQTFVIETRSNRPYSNDARRLEPMEKVEPVRMVLSKPSENVNIIITRLRQ